MFRHQLQNFRRRHQVAALFVGLCVVAHPAGGASGGRVGSQSASDSAKPSAECSAYLRNVSLASFADYHCATHGLSSLPVDCDVIGCAVAAVVQDQIALSVIADNTCAIALGTCARHMPQICVLCAVGIVLPNEQCPFADSASGLVDRDYHGCYSPFSSAAFPAGIGSGRSAAGSVLSYSQRNKYPSRRTETQEKYAGICPASAVEGATEGAAK
jgi:hypothetical protein